MDYSAQKAVELGMLTLLIGREALNQAWDTMLCVGWTVRNRVLRPRYWGKDWLSVISYRWAYSSMTAPGDPNLVKYPDFSFPQWTLARTAAETAYSGIGPDPSGGATHYFDRSLDGKPPEWVNAPGSEFILNSGAFHFYKAE